jgi:hypothetical protein
VAAEEKAGGGVGEVGRVDIDVIAAVAMFCIPIFGLRFVTIQADPELKPVQGRVVELELPEPKNENKT